MIYYPALSSYIVLDIKGDRFKLWAINPETKEVKFLRYSKYSTVKFGNFFKLSQDGQKLYLNYADKGIQIIDSECERFELFEPSKTINCPPGDSFIDVVPFVKNDENWLLVATKLGCLCVLD